MAAAIPRDRLLQLTKLQTSIFSQTFNPDRQRLGNKVLRQRLKGPTLAAYYPRRSLVMSDMLRTFTQKFGFTGFNEKEEERLENVQLAKMRGKGAPKKIRTKDDGKKNKKKGGKK